MEGGCAPIGPVGSANLHGHQDAMFAGCPKVWLVPTTGSWHRDMTTLQQECIRLTENADCGADQVQAQAAWQTPPVAVPRLRGTITNGNE